MGIYEDDSAPCEHVQALIRILRDEVQVLDTNANTELDVWCVQCHLAHTVSFRPRKPKLVSIKGGKP